MSVITRIRHIVTLTADGQVMLVRKKCIRPDILSAVILTAAAAASGLYASFGTAYTASAPAVSVCCTETSAEETALYYADDTPDRYVYTAAVSVCDASSENTVTTALSALCEEATSSPPETEDTPPAKETAAVSAVSEDICIDINTASEEELCLLDGIGEATARKIIEYRTECGGFSDITQIMEVNGIGEKKFSAISDRIYTSYIPVRSNAPAEESVPGEIVLININTAAEEELMSLDGIGEVTARKIIEYRRENGGFSSAEDIMNVKGIGEKKFNAIKNRICV